MDNWKSILVACLLFVAGWIVGYNMYPKFNKPQSTTVLDTTFVGADTSSVSAKGDIRDTTIYVVDTVRVQYFDSVAIAVSVPAKIEEKNPDKETGFGFPYRFGGPVKDDTTAFTLTPKEVKVASVDTVLKNHGRIVVDYLFPPVNRFDIHFYSFEKEVPVEVKVPDISHLSQKSWYEQEELWFGVGVATTVAILWAANKVR